jgi:HEAT repeat protein
MIKAANGEDQPARSMTALVKVDRVLKGASAPTIAFHFLVPETPNGYSTVSVLSYRILFLSKQVDGTYEFASPYYPSLPAVTDAPRAPGSPIVRVLEELSHVVASMSASASAEQRREAIFAMSRSRTNEATDLLQQAFNEAGSTVKLDVAAALLERNNIVGLDAAVNALLRPTSLPPYLMHNLSYSIAEGVKDQRAIPALGRLLASPNPEVRRSAVSALRHTESPSAESLLAGC